jgi:DNA-binding PadR family transcriptional regulator
MLGRRIFDLIILSIVNDHPEGISAYNILKEIKDRFADWNPSPGTVYPLLKRLTSTGDINEDTTQDPSIYRLSPKGKEYLQTKMPENLLNSLETFPNQIFTLFKSLPQMTQFKIVTKLPPFLFGNQGCQVNWGDFFSDSQYQKIPSEKVQNKLREMKGQLDSYRNQIQTWAEDQIKQIEDQIKKIDEKIQSVEENKKKWKKIPVEDGD